MVRTWSGVRAPSTFTCVRRASTICWVAETPTSAVRRASSTPSPVSSSIVSRASSVSRLRPKVDWERASRDRSRTSRPADGGGRSRSMTTAGASGAIAATSAAASSGDAPNSADGGTSTLGDCPEGGSSRRVGALTKATTATTTNSARTTPRIRNSTTPEATDRLGGLRLAHPLADDLGDAVTAHRDAIERVGDLHGALLVRDDDQLRRRLEVGEQVDQPRQVAVVERRLDLVKHVERRRPGPEDRDEEGNGCERPLAAGEQGEPLHLLAGRPRLHLDTRFEPVVRVGEDESARAAREE